MPPAGGIPEEPCGKSKQPITITNRESCVPHSQCTSFRYVDSLPDLGVPGYVALDVRVGWRMNDYVTVSVGAKNLLDDRHSEFPPTLFYLENAEVQHSAYVKVVVTF